jgi:hypothetical protein
MKKLFALFGLMALFALVPTVVSAAPVHNNQVVQHTQEWNPVGNYVISFNCATCVPHNLKITSFNRHTGAFSGYGALASNPVYTWTVSGMVSGNQISMRILYTGVNAGYYVDLSGTIARNGTMSGIATQSSGGSFTWMTTRGHAWSDRDRDDFGRW